MNDTLSQPYIEGNYTFGILKQNLHMEQEIVIGRTDSNLDGKTGKIIGKVFDNVCDYYIILLDEAYLNQRGIILTEACLCPLHQ